MATNKRTNSLPIPPNGKKKKKTPGDKSSGPAVFNSYGDKEILPSILGGGGGGRTSSVHDSADASDVGADVDGGVSSSQQQQQQQQNQQINPHATAAGFQDGLRMLVEAHTATNSTSNGGNNSNDPNAAAVATVNASAALPRGVLEMASLTRTPSHSTPAAAAAVAAAQAAAGGSVDGGGGGMMRDSDAAGRARAKGRPAPPGTPGGTGGGRPSKSARTGVMGKADGGGSAGGGKADGAGGGGPDSKRCVAFFCCFVEDGQFVLYHVFLHACVYTEALCEIFFARIFRARLACVAVQAIDVSIFTCGVLF